MNQINDHEMRTALYQLAGKSFAGYLGFPSVHHYLEASTYFIANLLTGEMEHVHLSDRVGKVLSEEYTADFNRLSAFVLRHWTPLPNEPDIAKLFSVEHLLQSLDAGECFIETRFSLTVQDDQRREQIACQIQATDSGILALFLITDITDVGDFSMQMLHQMEFDALTQLYNRSFGDTYIMEYFRRYPQDSAAVMLIDIDFFKRFNDEYGHDLGDIVLQNASRRLERFFGRDSVIVRNGGDEFLVLLKNRTVGQVQDEIREFSIQKHSVMYQGKAIPFSFSIGFAMYPEQGKEYHDLAIKADVAMYHVKMHHRSSFCQFHPDMLLQKRTQLSFQLADIVSGIPGAVLVYKADGREEILFANEQLYDLFECDSMEDLLSFSGDSFRNIVHPDDLDRVEKEIWQQIAVNKNGLDYVSYRIITKTGRIKNIEDLGHLVHTQKYGDIFYVLLYDSDQKERIIHAANAAKPEGESVLEETNG